MATSSAGREYADVPTCGYSTNGRQVVVTMGSYGIGVSRAVAGNSGAAPR